LARYGLEDDNVRRIQSQRNQTPASTLRQRELPSLMHIRESGDARDSYISHPNRSSNSEINLEMVNRINGDDIDQMNYEYMLDDIFVKQLRMKIIKEQLNVFILYIG
jgi:hypothetical protein